MKASRKRLLCVPSVLGLALTGCASPGFPRPPSLHLPAPVTDLTATRIAGRVELHWTAPTSTTDGLDLTFPTTVEVCRDAASLGPAAAPAQPPCTPVLKVAGHAGPSSAVDQLASSLAAAQSPRQLLAYRVRVLNSAGRAAAPTAVALVPAGPSPATVEAFHAVQEKDGVLLEWGRAALASVPGTSPAGDVAAVEVLRTDLTPKPPSPPVSSRPPTGPPRLQPSKPPAPGRHSDPSAEIRLRPEATNSAADAAIPAKTPLGAQGMIDQSALPDGTYSYRAQRVMTITSGGKTFEILSESTPPVTIAMHDTFPPATPQGLVSVPGTTDSRPTIDLSWQPNIEADLAGYLVYRIDLLPGAPSGGGGQVRLTAAPIAGPAFRDAAVIPGRRYEYRVTAVDRSGNESRPSAPIQDSPEGR